MSDPRLKFFKIFLHFQSQDRLRIPPAFRAHMSGRKPQLYRLKGPSGDVWQVTLVKDGEKELYFASGWETFVKDHAMKEGELLVFSYVGHFDFKVQIFSHNACPKEAAFTARCSRTAGTGSSSGGRNPSFTKTVLASNETLGYMTIPLRFAKSNGLLRKRFVNLVNTSGDQWVAELWLRDESSQFNISRGWKKFSMGNKIKDGDVCTFELLPGEEESESMMMRVHINEFPTGS